MAGGGTAAPPARLSLRLIFLTIHFIFSLSLSLQVWNPTLYLTSGVEAPHWSNCLKVKVLLVAFIPRGAAGVMSAFTRRPHSTCLHARLS